MVIVKLIVKMVEFFVANIANEIGFVFFRVIFL